MDPDANVQEQLGKLADLEETLTTVQQLIDDINDLRGALSEWGSKGGYNPKREQARETADGKTARLSHIIDELAL